MIRVRGVRVLGPVEIDALKGAIPKQHHRIIFEICLWSGMRYVKIQRLYEHPEWFMSSRSSIHLSMEAQKKAKRKQLERWVNPIPPQLETELAHFFNGPKPPCLAV